MFTFVNAVLALIAATNLWAMFARQAPSIRETTHRLIGEDAGASQLRIALTIAGLSEVWLASLVFPLRELSVTIAQAWAVLVTMAACETIYTGRKMWAAVTTRDRTLPFTLQDSPWYRVWQVCYSSATIATCVFLSWPR